MRTLIESIQSIETNQETLRRRPYGVIEAVKQHGALKSLRIVFENGTTQDVVYPSTRISVLPSGDND